MGVVYGVTEALIVEGLDLNSNAEVAQWMRRLPRRIAKAGAAVVVLDHVTKNREGRGRYAIGAQHKLAGITGAAYSFSLAHSSARPCSVQPVEGAVTILSKRTAPATSEATPANPASSPNWS